MTVTKQQQLEWLAYMWADAWVSPIVEYVDMSVLSIGVFCTNPICPTHRITSEEWQQERDKMQKQQDNSWHDRGELPPVGCECIHMPSGKSVFIVAKHCSIDAVIFSSSPCAGELFYGFDDEFRPLRTEREKAIDEMKTLCAYPGSWNSTYKAFAEALYDAGYRKVKP